MQSLIGTPRTAREVWCERAHRARFPPALPRAPTPRRTRTGASPHRATELCKSRTDARLLAERRSGPKTRRLLPSLDRRAHREGVQRARHLQHEPDDVRAGERLLQRDGPLPSERRVLPDDAGRVDGARRLQAAGVPQREARRQGGGSGRRARARQADPRRVAAVERGGRGDHLQREHTGRVGRRRRRRPLGRRRRLPAVVGLRPRGGSVGRGGCGVAVVPRAARAARQPAGAGRRDVVPLRRGGQPPDRARLRRAPRLRRRRRRRRPALLDQVHPRVVVRAAAPAERRRRGEGARGAPRGQVGAGDQVHLRSDEAVDARPFPRAQRAPRGDAAPLPLPDLPGERAPQLTAPPAPPAARPAARFAAPPAFGADPSPPSLRRT